MVHHGSYMIKLAFGAQYKIVVPTLLTYLLSGLGLGLENAAIELIREIHYSVYLSICLAVCGSVSLLIFFDFYEFDVVVKGRAFFSDRQKMG